MDVGGVSAAKNMRQALEEVGFFVAVFDQGAFDILVDFFLDGNFDCEGSVV